MATADESAADAEREGADEEPPEDDEASGSTPPPWASASSAPSASSQPDLSHIMSKFSHEELAFLQAYWGSQQ